MSRKKKTILPAEWIDQIPTAPSVFKARVVSMAVILLCGLAWLGAEKGPLALNAFLTENPPIAALFAREGTAGALALCFHFFGAFSIVCVITGAVSLWRTKATYRLLRANLLIVYLLMGAYVYFTWTGAFSILAANDGKGLKIGGVDQDRVTILKLWWKVSWPALATVAYTAWLHLMTRSRSVYAAFTRETGEPLPGDVILEDLRTHGRDPRQRRSTYASAFTHVTIIIFIPLLMRLGGCVEAYKVPKGPGGNPVVAIVAKVKPQKPKKKNLTLRTDSAIILDIPDLDETEVDKMLEEESQDRYVAQANTGPTGKKTGKQGGGWPEGSDKYKFRFIRLDHGGVGWDDGMNETGADVNFMRFFAKATGFKKIAGKGESHSIALLKKYPADGFPPFVYLTGNSDMGRVSSRDAEILRNYCLNGGMLIADAGSARFHRSFQNFITRQVFPDKQLLDISDDDMLYQLPFGFPNGAPAFWGHGGRRALGMKHEGRWMVFYHPGDMNDAWKSPGYTKVTKEMRDAALQLGVNLVYYSFNQWDDAVAKARK
ncbi:MAG: DUF4159 domain-containing protein [Lentisphaeria bacterium]|nr:DUF4159 domain-containing protein [Lentisphaeria bacterium]